MDSVQRQGCHIQSHTGRLDSFTAAASKHVALRPQKRDGLLRTGNEAGGGGGGGGRCVCVCVCVWGGARPRAPTRKDRGDRGPPPEQQLCSGGGDLAIAKQLVYSAKCCFNCCADQSHKNKCP